MRYTGPSPSVLALVKARNDGVCLRCGLYRGEQAHHRRPRGSGGTSDEVANRPDNLVWVCAPCHSVIESQRSEAFECGWLVRHGVDEPYQIPLTDVAGWRFFLDQEGSVVSLARSKGKP